MRIALCGASSTGKTTVASDVSRLAGERGFDLPFLASPARPLLRSFGVSNIMQLDTNDLAAFQMAYFITKSSQEAKQQRFITDRSFVDVLAHWEVRDRDYKQGALVSLLSEPCRQMAMRYDLHVYCPQGFIPEVFDDYRSDDEQLNAALGKRMYSLLNNWQLPTLRLTKSDRHERAETVLRAAMGDIPIK